jgi:ATP-dependent Lon protease
MKMKKRSNMIWNDTRFIRKGNDNYRIYLATQIRMIMSELQKDEKVMMDWNTFEKTINSYLFRRWKEESDLEMEKFKNLNVAQITKKEVNMQMCSERKNDRKTPNVVDARP